MTNADALREAHRAADAAATPEARRAAIVLLERGRDALDPGAGTASTWAYQDANYRIARLEFLLGELQRAAAVVERGLEAGRRPSVPVGNLLELYGEILERQGRKQDAVAAYHEALLVNQALMNDSLGGSP